MFSFYADESGDMGLANDWLVLLAVGFDDSNWGVINDAINGLKSEFFPRWDLTRVEIKSVYLRRWNQPDKPWPPNPFATLKEQQVKEFSDRLFKLIYEELPIEWAASAINIPELVRQHGVSKPTHVFLWAYKLLIERLEGWLTAPHGVGQLGRLFLDQQHSNLVGGFSHEEIIKAHHDHQRIGTGYLVVRSVVEQPYFMESRYSAHIQIADILGYNVLRQKREEARGGSYDHYARMLRKCRGYKSWYGGVMAAPYGLKTYP